jgi:hypothetical protein
MRCLWVGWSPYQSNLPKLQGREVVLQRLPHLNPPLRPHLNPPIQLLRLPAGLTMLSQDENGNFHMVVHKYNFPDTNTQLWCMPGLKVTILVVLDGPNGQQGWEFPRGTAAELLKVHRKEGTVQIHHG